MPVGEGWKARYGGLEVSEAKRLRELWEDVMQERSAPRRSFDGHTLTTPRGKSHELYFVGYAFLNYLSTPLLFAELGFEVAEGNPHFGGKKWRRLHVKYPAADPTHTRKQTLYFNEKGLLQRLDYVSG